MATSSVSPTLAAFAPPSRYASPTEREFFPLTYTCRSSPDGERIYTSFSSPSPPKRAAPPLSFPACLSRQKVWRRVAPNAILSLFSFHFSRLVHLLLFSPPCRYRGVFPTPLRPFITVSDDMKSLSIASSVPRGFFSHFSNPAPLSLFPEPKEVFPST